MSEVVQALLKLCWMPKKPDPAWSLLPVPRCGGLLVQLVHSTHLHHNNLSMLLGIFVVTKKKKF